MKSSALHQPQIGTPENTKWWQHPYTIGAASTTLAICAIGYSIHETNDIITKEAIGAAAASLIVAPLVYMKNIGGTVAKDAIWGVKAALFGGGIVLACAESMGDRYHEPKAPQEKQTHIWHDNNAGITQLPGNRLMLNASDFRLA